MSESLIALQVLKFQRRPATAQADAAAAGDSAARKPRGGKRRREPGATEQLVLCPSCNVEVSSLLCLVQLLGTTLQWFAPCALLPG